jgi:hypothetical protein
MSITGAAFWLPLFLVQRLPAAPPTGDKQTVPAIYPEPPTEMRIAGGASGMWRHLHRCMSKGALAGWNSCYSDSYWHELETYPEQPMRALLMPHELKKILFFGTSYLEQVMYNLLFAAGEAHCKATDWDFNTLLSGGGKSNPRGQMIPAGRHSFHLVMNNAQFQSGERGLAALRKMLLAEAFDAAIYMRPHPRCFFDYKVVKALRWSNSSAYACVSLVEGGVHRFKSVAFLTADSRRYRDNDPVRQRGFLEAIRRHVHGPVVEVQPWRPAPRGLRAMPYADLANKYARLPTSPTVLRHPCKANRCLHIANGHQCNPGSLTLIAIDVVRMFNQILSNATSYHVTYDSDAQRNVQQKS